jgi:predicted RNase H-like HicB family nuclease
MLENTAMKRTIQAAIRRGERKYIAECLEFPIVTEASSPDELVRNIEESVALFLKDEDLKELGLAERPVVLATLELEAAA